MKYKGNDIQYSIYLSSQNHIYKSVYQRCMFRVPSNLHLHLDIPVFDKTLLSTRQNHNHIRLGHKGCFCLNKVLNNPDHCNMVHIHIYSRQLACHGYNDLDTPHPSNLPNSCIYLEHSSCFLKRQ